MSFILDALKKSEAERQLGEVPSLQTAGQIEPAQKHKVAWLLPLIIVLLAAVVLGWFWRQSVDNSAVQVAGSQLAEQAVDKPEPATIEQPGSDKLPRINESPLADYSPPADAITVTDGMDMPDTGKVVSISQDPAVSAKALQNEAQSSAGGVTNSPQAASELQRVDRLQKQRASERAEDEALVAAVEQRLVAERAAKATNKKTAAENSRSNTVRLNELPSSVRAEIPDINITMQVYSAEPGSRFAIINGKRYMESDQIADAVILDEILRKGIILKYRQYRILMN